MAFESVAGLASFDLVAGQRVPSVSPVLYEMIYQERDRAFLSRIADGPTVDEVQFSWWERGLRPQTVQADNDDLTVSPLETDLTVLPGHAARLVHGAILMDEADPRERIQVQSISGNVLTVIRGYGGTPTTVHAATAVYRIVALPTQEMSSVGLDLLRDPSERRNFLQIFRRDLKASRSSQGVKTFTGYHLNARRLQEKLVEIRDELEQVSLYGVPHATVPLGSDTVLRTTGGLFHFVTNVDTATYTGQTAMDLKRMIDADARMLMDNGADPNFFMAGGDIFGALMDLDSDKVRFQVTDGVRGSTVTAIRTKFGPILDLVYDRWIVPRRFVIGDYRKVQMRMFSVGGVPHIEELAKTKDGHEFMIIGELGFQIENGADAFRVRTDVSVV